MKRNKKGWKFNFASSFLIEERKNNSAPSVSIFMKSALVIFSLSRNSLNEIVWTIVLPFPSRVLCTKLEAESPKTFRENKVFVELLFQIAML